MLILVKTCIEKACELLLMILVKLVLLVIVNTCIKRACTLLLSNVSTVSNVSKWLIPALKEHVHHRLLMLVLLVMLVNV